MQDFIDTYFWGEVSIVFTSFSEGFWGLQKFKSHLCRCSLKSLPVLLFCNTSNLDLRISHLMSYVATRDTWKKNMFESSHSKIGCV
jgi:hypothetical protein